MRERRAYRNMPIIGKVAGIKVSMYYNDHAPPHVHIEKGDAGCVVDIFTPTIPTVAGFTSAEKRSALKWIRDNEDALLANWTRARMGYAFVKIT